MQFLKLALRLRSGQALRLRSGQTLDLLRRETFVHFVIAGAVLFAIDAVRASSDTATIIVTPEVVQGLMREREELLDRSASPDERSALVARYVDEEILLHEAYTRELYRRDGVVRRRLLELMRFLLLEEPAEPTARELRAYLGTHADVYRTPAAVTFSHVFYPADEDVGVPDAERLLSELRAGRDFRRCGKPFWLGSVVKRYPEPQLTQLLGAEFTQNVMDLPLHEWSGPIGSQRGIHFVRVEERRDPEMPPFRELLPMLRSDWLASKREERLAAKVDELRGRYRVIAE
jgi:peptidyl-prolyl cis-trans isomerase C